MSTRWFTERYGSEISPMRTLSAMMHSSSQSGDHGCHAIRLDRTFHDVIARQNGPHACLGNRLRWITIALLLHELQQTAPIHRVSNHDSLVAQMTGTLRSVISP
jgi:cytochrome P450